MSIVEDPEGNEYRALAAIAQSFRNRRILEIGCGDGRVTRKYAADAASVIAIDPKVEDIAALRASLPKVDARAIGIEELQLTPGAVDIAIFTWSL